MSNSQKSHSSTVTSVEQEAGLELLGAMALDSIAEHEVLTIYTGSHPKLGPITLIIPMSGETILVNQIATRV